MSNGSDPRVFFAAERTLLAWVRTGIAVIGMGFVVARFGLFLRMIVLPQAIHRPPQGSAALGVALASLGTIIVIGATWQHQRFCRALTNTERPANYWSGFAVLVAIGLSILGGLLTMHLAWGAFMQ